MIIDAMDILYQGKVDCFCLATSDSDFTNLAMRFRNDNIAVIGAGEQKTPLSFRRACDIFIAIDALLKTGQAQKEKKKATPEKSPRQTTPQPDKKRERLIRIATEIVREGADVDGWMHFSAFMNEIYRKENDFNPKLYGEQSSKPIPFFKNLTTGGKAVFTLKKNDNVDKIRINRQEIKK